MNHEFNVIYDKARQKSKGVTKMKNFISNADSTSLKTFLMDEDGDTNFISIIIILGIVIVLAGIFVAFKDQIIDGVQDIINGFSAESLGDKADDVVGG